MKSETWRLIVDSAGDGAWNMAVDRALQLSRSRGEAPPTLRVYGWWRPTVTLGAFQSADSVRFDACAAYGVDVVRRGTGGRGVLHDDEVTYSVIASATDGVPRGVVASYRYLCAGLVEAFRRLGVDSQLTGRSRGVRGSPACYLHAAGADVSAGVLKLSGSAQVWTGDTVLQHGSLTRTRDIERECAVFGLTAAEKEVLAATTTSLAELVKPLPDVRAIADALVGGFAAELKVSFLQSAITSAEARLAETLVAESRIGLLPR